MKIIEFNGVDHVFPDGDSPLHGLSLSIEEGNLHFIVGPSGSGKTTLLNLILGLYRPSAGEIWVNHQNICLLKKRQLLQYRQNIGTILQQNNLIQHRTVFENVALPLWLRGTDRRTLQSEVQSTLQAVGLANYDNALPLHLSSGGQQRVAIARAMISSPNIVLADEPTGNLDPDLSFQITALLKGLTENGTTVLMVTHDEYLRDYADEITELSSRAEPAVVEN